MALSERPRLFAGSWRAGRQTGKRAPCRPRTIAARFSWLWIVTKKLAQLLAEEAGSRDLRAEMASDSSAARELLGRCRPDVVILDLSLPQDARTVYDYWKSWLPATLPCRRLILTAHDSLIDRVEVARRGGKGFLQKPLPPCEVMDAVMQLLSR